MFFSSMARAFFHGAYSNTSLPLNLWALAFNRFLNAFSCWRRVVICSVSVLVGGGCGLLWE